MKRSVKRRSRYKDQVRRCTAEITMMLPELVNRHSPLVLLEALTEHVCVALFLSQEEQVCSAEKAQEIIQRVKDIAFARYSTSACAPSGSAGIQSDGVSPPVRSSVRD